MEEEDNLKKPDGSTPTDNDNSTPGLGPPIFTSYIYPYVKPTAGMSGGEGGSLAGLGAAPGEPSFVMFTYQFIPVDEDE